MLFIGISIYLRLVPFFSQWYADNNMRIGVLNAFIQELKGLSFFEVFKYITEYDDIISPQGIDNFKGVSDVNIIINCLLVILYIVGKNFYPVYFDPPFLSL